MCACRDFAVYESPIGRIRIEAGETGIRRLDFDDEAEGPGAGSTNPHLTACLLQLGEYFSGERTNFDVPLQLEGTPFQKSVWRSLLLISYGETKSYAEIATRIGRPKATRAVGGANHNNPVAIIVPCHRVIGRDGKLTGYGGGLWRKEWLLTHEAKERGVEGFRLEG